jgi:formate dehydrogenase subunit beta
MKEFIEKLRTLGPSPLKNKNKGQEAA